MGVDFSPEQKRWIEGFTSGAAAVRGAVRSVPVAASPAAPAEPTGPDASLVRAQDRAASAGKKLVDQEKWKRAEHPMDAYARLKSQALAGAKPKPEDNFRWRYHGLFYVAPAQDSYMCRMRVPNGILTHAQLSAIADLAERYGGGYADVTTRANLQVREILPQNGPATVEALAEAGILVKGAGADNIRNVTGSATAGIDPHELIDTRPHARAWHHHVLNNRSLYGLPRKFNVAFDGGGSIATLEDTNDIGFQAVEVAHGAPVEPGVWYRLTLGGITGHKDFARDTGMIVRPADATNVADAIVRVFIGHGDRTDRSKARLKYVLDALGFEKFLAAVEVELGAKLTRVEASHIRRRPAFDKSAHIGVHPQKQAGLNWIGVALPVGRLTSGQMRVVAEVARAVGDGDVRLTVWQNLLISGVADGDLADAKAHIEAIGLDWQATSIRAGLVACTGNRGCKFSASDTKRHALDIAEYLDARLTLDQPINIHLTGCHHSCAQHHIGDIGLLAAKVAVGEDGEQVEGYHILVGGGFGSDAAIAQPIYSDVKAEDAPAHVERLVRAYLDHRLDAAESFQQFARRLDCEALKRLAVGVAA